jgi:DNA repair exonuclease SbcCD ATPase subunit
MWRVTLKIAIKYLIRSQDSIITNSHFPPIPIQTRRCEEVLSRAEGKLNSLRALQSRVEQLEQRLAERRESLEALMDETDSELTDMLTNFEAQMRTRTQRLMELQRAVDGLNQDIAQLRLRTDELNTQRGQATSLQEQVKQLKADVAEKVRVCLFMCQLLFSVAPTSPPASMLQLGT